MDYKTKGISRRKIRAIAKAIRRLFSCNNKYYFDVIKAFETLPILFPEVTTKIIGNNDISEIKDVDIPGACIPDFKGHYSILIREWVYNAACNQQGGCRCHIAHEMSHFFLFRLGYTPNVERAFANNTLNRYESAEWQAKALAGETLVPYENTINMKIDSIMHRCNVSRECAELRRKLDEPPN